jgi:hypothetical protein
MAPTLSSAADTEADERTAAFVCSLPTKALVFIGASRREEMTAMWFLVSRRIRQFLFVSVLVPLVLRVVREIRVRMERRSGPTQTTRALGKVERFTLAPSRMRSR